MNPGALGSQCRHIHVFYLKKVIWQNNPQIKNCFQKNNLLCTSSSSCLEVIETKFADILLHSASPRFHVILD